ncbi:MAG TPA: type II secretion system protein [Thermoanaerobaculia bacterium]|jgi:general secretion pathway protein G
MAFCAYCGMQVGEVSYRPCGACGNPTNGAPRPPLPTGGKNAAAIAIAVVAVGLFAVAILGILAAIAIPNLLTAMQRSKQKRTMADMRVIATQLEERRENERRYPNSLPEQRKDGWGRNLRYLCWPELECTGYALISGGKDGAFQAEEIEKYPGGATTDFDDDIVLSNGEFVQYPQGVAK